jgi:hypothetical protein
MEEATPPTSLHLGLRLIAGPFAESRQAFHHLL